MNVEIFTKMLLAAILSFILPIYTSILLILLMIGIDFIFKLLVIKRNHESFDGDKVFTFVSKSIVYILLLVLLQAISPFLMTIPLLNTLGADFGIKIFTILAFTKELKSIDGKVKILMGFSLLNWLIRLLTLSMNRITKGIK